MIKRVCCLLCMQISHLSLAWCFSLTLYPLPSRRSTSCFLRFSGHICFISHSTVGYLQFARADFSCAHKHTHTQCPRHSIHFSICHVMRKCGFVIIKLLVYSLLLLFCVEKDHPNRTHRWNTCGADEGGASQQTFSNWMGKKKNQNGIKIKLRKSKWVESTKKKSFLRIPNYIYYELCATRVRLLIIPTDTEVEYLPDDGTHRRERESEIHATDPDRRKWNKQKKKKVRPKITAKKS